ncbi:MAG: bifunctional hydroxymethylpyrimidine kinase/phosphomethylpyrimidine kinase [Lachnospiraceae bacterium]|nr:bifunctional hydroxymethylpyrimidine kinase/phosphomethylpyrimidine kinase [Lachnospiraceae bacterium]
MENQVTSPAPSLSDPHPPKRLALVSDLTGYGRCSLTVALPVISQLGVQCCPVPTAVFSNHTGYPTWHMTDFTPELTAYLDVWKALDFSFDGILTSFLGNQSQAGLIRQFLTDFKKENTLYILDPAMGDNGKAYATCGEEIQESMRSLAALADVVTPNLTEACILTNTPWRPDFSRNELITLAQRLLSMGPRQVVITGIPCKSFIGNLCMTDIEPLSENISISEDRHIPSENQTAFLRTRKVARPRHGTGDIFSAILASELLKGNTITGTSLKGASQSGVLSEESSLTGKPLKAPSSLTGAPFPSQEALTAAVKKASGFVRKCLLVSDACSLPETECVCFEKILYQLKKITTVFHLYHEYLQKDITICKSRLLRAFSTFT